MKKRNIILTLAIVAILSGCQTGDSSGTTDEYTKVSITKSEQFEGYYKTDNYLMDLRDVRRSSSMLSMPSTGSQDVLLVPVEVFGKAFTPTMLEKLDLAFSGESSQTEWESVSTYYEKSSYGKLDLNFIRTEKVVFEKDSQWVALNSDKVVDVVIDNFNRAVTPEFKKTYDKDQDGYVDAICFIYSTSFSDDENSPFWAWCNWTNVMPNVQNPTINLHMWASYYFIDDGYGSRAIDAHTYIHEMGHMLGLDDYYPYDNIFNAAGCLDMQDNNILDHSVYSKMSLNWTYPYVVEDSANITLRPFESSGDCIIINNNWNGSALDEYLAIEFYTPTGLNEKDSQSAYPGNQLQGYTIPGIKIYHIDSRVARINYFTGFMNYTNYVSDYSKGIYSVAAANSNEWSYTDVKAGTYKLVHLMEAEGRNTFKYGKAAKNSTLFQQNTTFVPSREFFYNETKFNNRQEIGYSITVQSISDTSATIRVNRL